MNSFSTNATKGVIGVIGILYLLIIVCGVYAHFVVRTPWLESQPGTDFLAVLRADEMKLRLSLAADLVMVLCDIVVAYLFYVLFKPVHRHLARMAAVFRLIQSVIIIIGILLLFQLLPLISLDTVLPGMMDNPNTQAGWAFKILQVHGQVYMLSGVFFGISCALLGRLFLAADFLPDLLGILLTVAGMAYVADGFVNLLLPEYALVTEWMVIMAALIAEILVCLWFLAIGAKVSLGRSRKSVTLP